MSASCGARPPALLHTDRGLPCCASGATRRECGRAGSAGGREVVGRRTCAPNLASRGAAPRKVPPAARRAATAMPAPTSWLLVRPGAAARAARRKSKLSRRAAPAPSGTAACAAAASVSPDRAGIAAFFFDTFGHRPLHQHDGGGAPDRRPVELCRCERRRCDQRGDRQRVGLATRRDGDGRVRRADVGLPNLWGFRVESMGGRLQLGDRDVAIARGSVDDFVAQGTSYFDLFLTPTRPGSTPPPPRRGLRPADHRRGVVPLDLRVELTSCSSRTTLLDRGHPDAVRYREPVTPVGLTVRRPMMDECGSVLGGWAE